MNRDVINLQASVRAQLQNKAKETNRSFAEVLQFYGMERFLYRFSKSQYARQFILKGALMFTAWNIPDRRTTIDIDFLARCNNQVSNIEKVINDICEIAVVPDGLLFDQEIYDEKSDRQTLWMAFLRKNDIKHAQGKLSTTAKEIEIFMIKPIDAIKKETAFNNTWNVTGNWVSKVEGGKGKSKR